MVQDGRRSSSRIQTTATQETAQENGDSVQQSPAAAAAADQIRSSGSPFDLRPFPGQKRKWISSLLHYPAPSSARLCASLLRSAVSFRTTLLLPLLPYFLFFVFPCVSACDRVLIYSSPDHRLARRNRYENPERERENAREPLTRD